MAHFRFTKWTYLPVTAKIVNRLSIILITAVLMMLTLLDWQLSPIRVLFAIALVTILPGYAITTAIFVNTPLGITEKIAFSCGFSLGMTSLGGLLINFTQLGIQPTSWVILLGGVSIIGNVVALVRIKDQAQVDLRVVHVPLQVKQVVFIFFAAAIMFGSYWYARNGAENRSLPATTRMWINWTDESQNNIVLKVQNLENIPMEYQVQLSTLSGQLQSWPPITLNTGDVWEGEYEMPPNAAESDFIKATLFQIDSPGNVYREVFLRRVVR
jgi:hypothetical protein